MFNLHKELHLAMLAFGDVSPSTYLQLTPKISLAFFPLRFCRKEKMIDSAGNGRWTFSVGRDRESFPLGLECLKTGSSRVAWCWVNSFQKLGSKRTYHSLWSGRMREVQAGRREEFNFPPCNSGSYCKGLRPHFPNGFRNKRIVALRICSKTVCFLRCSKIQVSICVLVRGK